MVNKQSIGNLLAQSVVLAFCLNFCGSGSPAASQEHWGGRGGSSGFGGPVGPGGFGNSFALIPAVVADVLLVPSLTKAQQTKVRTLYIEYRAKSAGRMDVMNKLRGSSRHGHDSERGSNSPGKGTDPVGNDHSRGSGRSGKSDGSGDGKRRHGSGNPEDSMDNASSNLRRTMFMSMIKEYQKFQENVVGVLTEKQHAELKEIAKKAGSPDYFAIRHYDIMNAD